MNTFSRLMIKNKARVGIVFVLTFFALLALIPLGMKITSLAKADIPGPVLYPCPATLVGWGLPLNYQGIAAGLLPNGHPFCGYMGLYGDYYWGAYDKVLGVPITYYMVVQPTSSDGYNTLFWNLTPALHESTGSTGSKCTTVTGEAIYYISHDCGALFSGVATPASMQAVGVDTSTVPSTTGMVFMICVGGFSGTCTIPGKSPPPPPETGG
jgi:hypothetical protein